MAFLARPLSLLPAALPLLRRCYFSAPLPTLSHSDVLGLLQSHSRRNTAGSTGYGGPRLTPAEFGALGQARRSGVLQLSAEACTPQLCNSFYVYCWSVGRPYIALGRHGVQACCDLAPLAGLGSSSAVAAAGEARVVAGLAAAAAALASAQAARPGLQLVNAATLRAQAAAALPGPTEGSNAHRTPDTAPARQFSLHAPSRQAALEATLALARALGAPQPGEVAARRATLDAARVQRRRATLVRRLDRLANDAVAVKNLRVPAGAIEGFVKAREAGLVKELR